MGPVTANDPPGIGRRTMDKVLITRRIPQPGIDLLARTALVEISPFDRPLTRPELLEMSAGCRAILITLTDRMDAEFFAARPEVRCAVNYAVGYDNFDLEAARRAGVVLANCPGVLSRATADLTMALMLAVMRRLVEGDAEMRAGRFAGFQPFYMLGTDLFGKTLGIYGLCDIGLEVGRRAVAFGMHVIYHNRRPNPTAENELGARRVAFDDLLALSDVISINAPLTRETRHAFDYAAICRMKPSAYLVNTGRGPIVKEDDLALALSEKRIAGAALDVYEHEPAVDPGLVGLPNVVLAPHLGSATVEARTELAIMAAHQIAAFLRGEEVPHRLT